MFSSFNLASLTAFVGLLASYGSPFVMPEDYEAYMRQSSVLEQIELARTLPEFDRIYYLWERQYTRAKHLEALRVFEQEIASIKVKLESRPNYSVTKKQVV